MKANGDQQPGQEPPKVIQSRAIAEANSPARKYNQDLHHIKTLHKNKQEPIGGQQEEIVDTLPDYEL